LSTPHHVRFPRRSPLRLRERGLAVFMHPAASQGGGKRALNAHVAVTGALLPDLSLLARPDRSPSRIAVSPFVVRPGYACGGALSRHRRGYAGSLRRAERARRKGTRAVARAWGFACTPKERCVSTSPRQVYAFTPRCGSEASLVASRTRFSTVPLFRACLTTVRGFVRGTLCRRENQWMRNSGRQAAGQGAAAEAQLEHDTRAAKNNPTVGVAGRGAPMAPVNTPFLATPFP
jgi:hypothetical protein